jgi:hypothetical protein
MNSAFVKRVFWPAAAAMVLLLAVTSVGVAQAAPAGQSGGAKIIDLNTASQAALETLPGIDPAMARQIIANRPFKSVADLSKAGVPADTIERITPLVKVGLPGRVAATTGKGADKAASGVGKGAGAAATGVEKGVGAAATGVEKGAGAAASGVEKGASATGSAAGKVKEKVTGTPREPPQAGMVWANTASKIYYKEGDRWYGKTKSGKWLTEEEAVKQGYRAAK